MNFKILAETIAEKQYLDVQELELQLEFFFKLWKSTEADNEFFKDDIQRKRISIFKELSELSLKRTSLEHQVLSAKNDLKLNKYVNLDWMARLNYSFRITKRQLDDCKERLTLLKAEEKLRNIKLANIEDRQITILLKNFVKENFGDEKLMELIASAKPEANLRP